MNAPKPLKIIIDAAKVNAYAAIINAGVRMRGGNKPLDPQVEYIHPPDTEDPLYNDSWYFNFFDKEQKIGGFTRIGRLANQQKTNGILFLFYGEKEVLMLFNEDSLPGGSEDIKSGPMHYEIIEPLKRLRIVGSGKFLRVENPRDLMDRNALLSKVTDKDFVDVNVDVVFDGLSEIHNFGNIYARGLASRMVEKGFGLRDLAEVRKVASEHYEQVGAYSGTIEVGSRKIDFNAVGHRDHSWGIRDWSAPSGWTWLTMQFGTEVALNLSRVQIGKVDIFNGYISRGGRNYPYRKVELETEFEQDGLTQKNIHFSVQDTGGFTMDVEGNAINVVPLVQEDGGKRSLVNEAMAEYRWQGRTSLGIAEYLHKIA
jgi:hypothetical protein